MPNLVNYGQHFLISLGVKQQFLKWCQLNGNERVLEIGPGQGALTQLLAPQCHLLTSVEIDQSLSPQLTKLQKQYPNLQVLYGNVLERTDWSFDLVCGALSYALFEPLVMKLFANNQFQTGVFIVSSKVEQHFQSQSGRLYYLLSAFFKVEFSETIAPKEFDPPPRTGSIIVRLTRLESPSLPEQIWQQLFRQGDKKLKNSLKEAIIQVAGDNGQIVTQKQALLAIKEITSLPEADLTVWQLRADFLPKLQQIIVYSPYAQPQFYSRK